jgi:hypothetical protein
MAPNYRQAKASEPSPIPPSRRSRLQCRSEPWRPSKGDLASTFSGGYLTYADNINVAIPPIDAAEANKAEIAALIFISFSPQVYLFQFCCGPLSILCFPYASLLRTDQSRCCERRPIPTVPATHALDCSNFVLNPKFLHPEPHYL